jgi:hypothetical protein
MTNPENGSENVSLDEVIKITFDGELDPDTITTSNVKLINYTANSEVLGATVQLVDTNTAILVTAPSTSTGGHRFEGLNDYKVMLAGVANANGEVIDGAFQLRFTTQPGSVTEVIPPPPPPVGTVFEIVRTYPKETSVTTPDTIKILCSKNIDTNSDLNGIMLIEDDSIMTIEEAVFMGQNLIQVANISILNNILTITIPEDFIWKNGTLYNVVITGIKDVDGNTIVPRMFSFYAGFAPFYSNVSSVKSSVAVSNILGDTRDIDISLKIYENSRLAEFIATEAEQDITVWATTLPMYVSEYVKYKTQYDIVFDKFIDLSSGPSMKQMKDLMVQYVYTLSDLLKMADRLKLQYQYWEDYLRGHTGRGRAVAAVFQRGSDADEDPDFMNRQIKELDGTKSW